MKEKTIVITGHIMPKKISKFEIQTNAVLAKNEVSIIKYIHTFKKNFTAIQFHDILGHGEAEKVIFYDCTDHTISKVVGHFNEHQRRKPPVMMVVNEKEETNKLGLPVVENICNTKSFKRMGFPVFL